jgi:hypothetical protein
VLHPIFQEDEFTLIVSGAVLGAIAGAVQQVKIPIAVQPLTGLPVCVSRVSAVGSTQLGTLAGTECGKPSVENLACDLVTLLWAKAGSACTNLPLVSGAHRGCGEGGRGARRGRGGRRATGDGRDRHTLTIPHCARQLNCV